MNKFCITEYFWSDDYSRRYRKLDISQKIKFILLREGKEVVDVTEETLDLILLESKLEVDMEEKKNEVATVTGMPTDTAVAVIQAEKKGTMALQEVITLGAVLYKSRFFTDLQNADQAVAKILAGQELGLPPMQSLAKVYVQGGKTAVMAEVFGGMIKMSGVYDYNILRLSNAECALQFLKNGKPIEDGIKGIITYTIDDARKAGLVKSGGGYEKNPKNMLFAKALSNGGRWYCPHLIHNAYTYEDMGLEVNDFGRVINGTTSTERTVETVNELAKTNQENPKSKTPSSDYFRASQEAQEQSDTKAVEPELKPAQAIEPEPEKKPTPEPEQKTKLEESLEPPISELKPPTRADELNRLKKIYGEDELKKIKKELGLVGKMVEISDDDWKKFLDYIEKKR